MACRFSRSGFFASVPNLIGMSGNVIGGMLTDRFVKSTGSVDVGRKIGFTCAFLLGALSMTMPFVTNDYLAVVLMGLALFGNQWVAATYIGTVGDVVPQQLAGRVNGIAGLGDNGAALLAVLYTGVIVDSYGWTPVFLGAGMLPFLAMVSVFLVLRKIEPAKFDFLGGHEVAGRSRQSGLSCRNDCRHRMNSRSPASKVSATTCCSASSARRSTRLFSAWRTAGR